MAKCGVACSFVRRRFYVHRGVGLRHTYMYYMHYTEDGSTTKFVVAAVWFLDTLHTSFSMVNSQLACHMMYYYLVKLMHLILASVLVNSSVIAVVQCVSLSTEVVSDRTSYPISTSSAWIQHGLVNNAVTYALRDRFYTTTPAGSIVALAEVLITVSLCVLLYDGGSHCVVPRTKRLLNTLIVYAVNRCGLIRACCGRIAVIAEVIMMTAAFSDFVQDAYNMVAWAIGVDFIISKIYTNSLLASLNTRQHLQSLDSGLEPDLCMNTIRFADRPTLSGDIGGSKDGVRRFDDCEMDVIDITTEPAASAGTTTLCREAEK
ncbi:hypothetical protein EDD17DRAFT_1789451 [Pisolithus thermaeus]|nr:hypothetical protein EDD17DRAFT_1789451 [Pisolithus thermaeus]